MAVTKVGRWLIDHYFRTDEGNEELIVPRNRQGQRINPITNRFMREDESIGETVSPDDYAQLMYEIWGNAEVNERTEVMRSAAEARNADRRLSRQRHRNERWDGRTCAWCASPLTDKGKGRLALTHPGACRQAYWRSRKRKEQAQ